MNKLRATRVGPTLFLGLILMMVPLLAQAGPSDLDPTFGDGGHVVTDVGIDDVLTSLSLARDTGKIRAGGYTTCFGECSATAKVPHWLMTGYTPEGQLDPEFSGDGIVREAGLIGEIRALETSYGTFEPSSGTLAAGWTARGSNRATVVAYQANGARRNYFEKFQSRCGCGTGVWFLGQDALTQEDRDAGRVLPHPSVANSIDFDEYPTYDCAYFCPAHIEQRMMIAGAVGADNSRDFLVASVSADSSREGYDYSGILNSWFADKGILRVDIQGSYDEATTAVPWVYRSTDPIDNSEFEYTGLLVGGFSWNGHDHDFALMRVTTDGSLDTSFGGDGIVATGVNRYGGDDGISALKILPDGKILAAGNSCYPDSTTCYFALVRYNSDGTVDTSFGTGRVGFEDGGGTMNGFGANDHATAMAVSPDGNIYLAGYTALNGDIDRMVARYLPDGTPDPNFGANGVLVEPTPGNDAATAIGLTDEGNLYQDLKVIVGGSITQNGAQNFDLFRLLGENTGAPEPSPTPTPTASPTPTPDPSPTDPSERVESSISLDIAKTAERLKASGEVEPLHQDLFVKVVLLKKVSGDFVKINDKDVPLDEFSSYIAKFDRPNAERCRIKVRFEGDADHLPSSIHKTFDC